MHLKTDFKHLIYSTFHIFLLKLIVIGLISIVFATGPGYLGSIPGLVIPNIQKIVLDAVLFYNQPYNIRIKSKVGQSRVGVAPFLKHRCCSDRKGAFVSPLSNLNYIHIYIYIYVYSTIKVK